MDSRDRIAKNMSMDKTNPRRARRIKWLAAGALAALLLGGPTAAGAIFVQSRERADTYDVRTHRIHMVDHRAGEVWLFRGPNPVVRSETFAYEKLVAAMRAAAKRQGAELPPQFYMLDVSFLFLESVDVEVERQFFADNPTKGEFLHYPVFGLMRPAWLQYGLNRIARASDYYGGVRGLEPQGPLEGRAHALAQLDIEAVHVLRALLEKTYDRPVVIYAHCEAGCDRAGEVIGAYRMQYQGLSAQEAFDRNTQECGREENGFSTRALQAYCRWLGQADCTLAAAS